MKKVRIHELAKKLGLSSKQLVNEVQGLGVEIKSYMSTVDEDTAQLILEMLSARAEESVLKANKKIEEERSKLLQVSRPSIHFAAHKNAGKTLGMSGCF